MKAYIDMHCDTLMKAWMSRKKDIVSLKKTMVDGQRLLDGGCKAQFFAIFMLPITMKKYLGPLFPRDEQYYRQCLEIFNRSCHIPNSPLAAAGSWAQVQENAAGGKVSGILTIEDGRILDGDPAKLESLYNQGIRLISLTWNHPNCLGYPNSVNSEWMEKGLTAFGRDTVLRMNELGMLVDVSHLSDGGFWDVAALSTRPFVASHSNCRALNPHSRSMSDEMIRKLADQGGVMGLNFGPAFLTGDPKNKVSRLCDLTAQLRHMINVGGTGCAAIGTDFDGVSGQFDISGPEQMNELFAAMEQANFTAAEIDAVAEENIARVLKDVLGP